MLVVHPKGNSIAMTDPEKNLRGPSMYVRLNARESETLRSIADGVAVEFAPRTIKRLVGLGLIKAGLASDGTSRLTREGVEWIGANPAPG